MKKILSVLLTILVLSMCFASCNAPGEPQKTTPKATSKATSADKSSNEITLTTNNIKKYLNISGQYGKITRESKIGVSFGYSDFTINIDPAIPGDFYNVSITLKVKLTNGWDVSSSDPAYSKNDGYLTTTIKLPANGSKEAVHSLIAAASYGNHNNQNVKVEIVSVSGSFVRDN